MTENNASQNIKNIENIEIICPACSRDSLLKREPVYDGFRKTGEKLACMDCGHVFNDENSVPFKDKRPPRIFKPEDTAPEIKVFKEGEAASICRRCAEYVVNPFLQRCARQGKIVEATDTCGFFNPRKGEKT